MHWWHIQKLKFKNAKARLDGLRKLAKEENPDNLDIFLTLLADADPEIRAEAARETAKFREDRATAPLVRLLSDPAAQVREAAVVALKELRDSAAVPALQRLLKDTEGRVRYRAATALESLGWSAGDPEERAQFLVAMGRPDRAAYEQGAAVPALIFGLNHSTGYKRQEIVTVIAELDDPRVVKPLIDALRDSDANVRAAVVEALGHVRDARAIEPLIHILRDKESRVRSSVVESLAKIANPKALPALVKCLKDPALDVRIAAAQSLGKFKDASAVDPLVECLKSKDHDLRQSAARSLGVIGHPRAIPALVTALVDEQESVRGAADIALCAIDRNWEQSDLVKVVIPSLQEAARSSEYWVRQSATAILERLNRSGSAPIEGTEPRVMERSGTSQRFVAYEILSLLVRDNDRDMRLAAAENLGRLGDRRGSGQLYPALDDADEWVRHAAANSLQSLQWEPADAEQQAKHLVALGQIENASQLKGHAREPLLNALQSVRPSIRSKVATALPRVDAGAAATMLPQLLNDPEPLVRQAASDALNALKASG